MATPPDPTDKCDEDDTMVRAGGLGRGVLCAGRYGSGSTWAFNAATKVLCTRPSYRVVSLYADRLEAEVRAAIDGSDSFVLKTHLPDGCVRALGGVGTGVATIVTTRDPRDAVASMMMRFRRDFAAALDHVRLSADHIVQLAKLHRPLVLPYEAGFIGSRGLTAIAGLLGVSLPEDTAHRIACELSAPAVARHVSELLARGVFTGINPTGEWETGTHWHPFHVGDGRIGKFRDLLSADEIRCVLAQTEPFCLAFGYGGIASSPTRSESS
jgi:hypothetical protein